MQNLSDTELLRTTYADPNATQREHEPSLRLEEFRELSLRLEEFRGTLTEVPAPTH